MSRSYKKTPFIRQEEEDYHYLNRQIRRDKLAEIPKGSSLKNIVHIGIHGTTFGRGNRLKKIIIHMVKMSDIL